MNLKASRMVKWCTLVTVLAWSGCVHAAEGSSPTNAVPSRRQSATATGTNLPAAKDCQPVSFETLAAFPIKVDWLVNPTNSSFDTLRRTGDIPAAIQALHGQKVELRGYLKSLQQDAGGMREFLLMRGHALCCQTNIPQINEWVHVRMTGPSLPFVPESLFTVRGVLAVGEAMGPGNVVSVYRLTGEEIRATPGAH